MMGVKGTRKLRLICLAEDQGARGHFEVEMGNCRLMPFTFASTGLGKVKCGTGAVYLWREVQQNSQMAFLKTWNYPPPPLA